MCALPATVLANGPGPNINGTYDINATVIPVLLLIYVIVIASTCLTEWLVSIPFGLHDTYTKKIVVINIVTQIVMHILELLIPTILPGDNVIGKYLLSVLIAEVFVYISEFLIYCRIIPDFTKEKLLLYTLCANTASILSGLLLLFIIL